MNEKQRNAVDGLKSEIENGTLCFTPREACPMCGGKDGWLLAEKERMGIPQETVMCSSCGSFFAHRVPTDESLRDYYRRFCSEINWSRLTPEESFRGRISDEAPSWRRYSFMRDNIGAAFFSGNRLIGEIGCGDGCNLYPFHKAGLKVVGFDLDERRLAAGKKEGMDLNHGSIEDLKEYGRQVDILVLSHLLEHVPDLSAYSGIYDIVNEGGFVYVEVPGWRWWNRPFGFSKKHEGFKSTWDFLSYLQFEHFFHYDLSCIEHVVGAFGFRLIAGDEWCQCLFRKEEKKSGRAFRPRTKARQNLFFLKYLEWNWFLLRKLRSFLG